MKFVFLGTTGYHPNNRRHTASIMFPEIGLILDAGTGIFRARDLLQTESLNIFLSHAHLDHCLGLTFLFDIGFDNGLQQTRVHGEATKLAAIENHLLANLIFPARLPLEFRPLPDNPMDGFTIELPGATTVTAFPLKHPGGSLGFVIEQRGKRVAYVTDTTADLNASYLQYLQGVDVLIHECYFPDGYEAHAELTGHSCATPVAEVARAVGAGELYCVHVNPLDESDDPIGLEGIRAIFPKAYIPEDLDVVEI